MKWKKCKGHCPLFVLILSIICSLCSCQAKKETESQSKEKLPKIKIGVDLLKPFFYIEQNGDYKGIDAEIAVKACELAGYQPQSVSISWSDRDEYLEKGEVDCLWSAFCKDGREDKYLWTDTYLNSKLKAIVEEKCPLMVQVECEAANCQRRKLHSSGFICFSIHIVYLPIYQRFSILLPFKSR